MLQAAAAAGRVLSTGLHMGVLCSAAQHMKPLIYSKVQTKELSSLFAMYSSASKHETWHYPPELQESDKPDLVYGHSKTSLISPPITSIICNRTDAGSSSFTTARFENACQHLSVAATKDTKWSSSSKAALQRVDEDLGGSWVLVQCGHYTFPGEEDPHKLAGRPARALVHVTLWGWEIDESIKSKRNKNGINPSLKLTHFMNAEATQFMSPESKAFVHWAPYELDADGWPTGRLFKFESDFERQTTYWWATDENGSKLFSSATVCGPALQKGPALKSWVEKLAPSDFILRQNRRKLASTTIRNAYKIFVQPLEVSIAPSIRSPRF